jgi:hypothetical protein
LFRHDGDPDPTFRRYVVKWRQVAAQERDDAPPSNSHVRPSPLSNPFRTRA